MVPHTKEMLYLLRQDVVLASPNKSYRLSVDYSIKSTVQFFSWIFESSSRISLDS